MNWQYVILAIALTHFAGLADSRAFLYAAWTWPNDRLSFLMLGWSALFFTASPEADPSPSPARMPDVGSLCARRQSSPVLSGTS